MEKETALCRYIELILTHGLNLQSGQILNIAAEACHREFAFRIGEAAYQRGALFVNIDLIEPRLQRARVINSSVEQMKYAPAFLTAKYGELVDARGANLRLVGPEDPDVLSDLDPQKVNTGRMANYHAIKRFYDEGIDKSLVHWTLAAAATPGWAKKVFPEKSAEEGESLLWNEIFRICRLDRPDFLSAWQEHNAQLRTRARRLSDLSIASLHFQGPGTDLTVGLSPRAVFRGGTERGPYGQDFEPNIPTEECFTTPDWRKTEGSVRTTRPFFINGTLVEGLEIEFQAGQISKAHAAQGLNTFNEYTSSDAGAKRLGEVALVGTDSPIYRSGLVFQEILLDENAACHIAVGSAYKFCLKDGERLSAAELNDLGCNESSVHTDMMISSEAVDVTAKTFNGSEILQIKNGSWVDRAPSN